ncbi:MAG: golvesin C-terminal-like domain-containing protein [Anaerolineae bacterium]
MIVLPLGAPSPGIVATQNEKAPINYYVDSTLGSDANSGASSVSPWRSLARVNAQTLQPGDTVHLRRGRTYDGGLVLKQSGVDGLPITIKAYGDGTRPILRNPGSAGDLTDIVTIEGDWVVVHGLLLRDAHNAGVYIARGVEHAVVWDLEITAVGIGVSVRGANSFITSNYVHDLAMVVSTPGGKDDYGAVGIWLFGSDNTVSHNRLVNCSAPSYDYGVDGGAVEWWGNADRNTVVYNWAQGCAGFMEMGGGAIRDTLVAYNVSINNDGFVGLHLGNQFAATIERFRLENNTVVELADGERTTSVLNFIWADPDADVIAVRNNIFYINGHWRLANRPGFAHERNLYFFASSEGQLGFEPSESDVLADPLFIDLDAWDLRLQSTSPAIGVGLALNHTADMAGSTLAVGRQPSLGAYEYQVAATPAPRTRTAVPTPTPTARPTPRATPTPSTWWTVVDDRDPGFTTRSTQDVWTIYAQVEGDHWAGQHHYNRQLGSGGDVATWRFEVPRRGTYAVYAWWWAQDNRPADVPYTVYHVGGATTVRVNQTRFSASWVLLGRFIFDAEGAVQVSDAASEGADVVADAVRIVLLEPDPDGGSTSAGALPLAQTLRRGYME